MTETEAHSLDLITLEEAARRSGRATQTLRHWICQRKLTGEKGGLHYVAGKPMVNWHEFANHFIQRAA